MYRREYPTDDIELVRIPHQTILGLFEEEETEYRVDMSDDAACHNSAAHVAILRICQAQLQSWARTYVCCCDVHVVLCCCCDVHVL